MSDEIVIENRVDENGIWHMHIMSNNPIGSCWKQLSIQALSVKDYKDELRLHHLELERRIQGPVDIQAEGWPKSRRFVMRPLLDGDRMSQAIEMAAQEFSCLFHFWPGFAFTRKLPNGIETGIEVAGTMLFEAEWMIRRYVAVGGRSF